MMSDRERFEHLLPFYVNATLSVADKRFVESYLAEHEHARASLALTLHIEQTIQGLAHRDPDDERVRRFLDKLALEQASLNDRVSAREQLPFSSGRQKWWLVLAGFGGAALASMLLLLPGLFPGSALHWDQLDGRPDVQLTLAENLTPSDPVVVAYLEQHNAQILEQTEVDGRYRIVVDLKSRAHDQHPLIQAMRDQGHLESYTLLAVR